MDRQKPEVCQSSYGNIAPGSRLLWFIGRLFVPFFFLIAFRLRVFGQRHVPETGGILIASSHQSFLDPVLLAIGRPRMLAYMARRTLFRQASFARLIRWLNAFPVTRGGRDKSAVRHAVERLRCGWGLAVFPEGTRTEDGGIGPLRPGVLAMAVRANVPIVPAAIDGAFAAWPRGRLPRIHPIAVQYGRAIRPEEYRKMSRAELAARLRTDVVALRTALKRRAIRDRGVSELE